LWSRPPARGDDQIAFGLRDFVEAHLRRKGLRGDDLDELSSEAVLRILAAADRHSDTAPAVSNQYALTVANNLFNDHLRRTKPRWSHLKRRVLIVLEHPEGGLLFARWKVGADSICGFRRWKGRAFSPTEKYLELTERSAVFEQEMLGNRLCSEVSLPELLAALFHWIETPLDTDELVACVARLRGVDDAPSVSLDELSENAQALSCSLRQEDTGQFAIAAIAGEQCRGELWNAILQLQPSHRIALLLGLTREELLLVSTSVSEAAAALGMSLEAFIPDWRRLPFSDSQIADRLGVTPKQVSNFRVACRARLARWMARSGW
jgi:hypothetical protein